MNKQDLLRKMQDGEQKEIEVNGLKMLIKSPSLKDYNILYKFEYARKNDINEVNFSDLAKIVINNTCNPENGEPFFNKGDFSVLQNDRSGFVTEISGEIFMLMKDFITEDTKESKKN